MPKEVRGLAGSPGALPEALLVVEERGESMNQEENAVRTAARMYEMRDTAKRLFPDNYAEKVAPWVAIIMGAQEKHKCDPLDAVMHLSQEAANNKTPLDSWDVLLLVAATVEMSETDRILEKIPSTHTVAR